MTVTVILAKGYQRQMADLTKPGKVSMLIPVPRGGLAAFERDPLVAAFLENGATLVAEFEDAEEADLFEARMSGKIA